MHCWAMSKIQENLQLLAYLRARDALIFLVNFLKRDPAHFLEKFSYTLPQDWEEELLHRVELFCHILHPVVAKDWKCFESLVLFSLLHKIHSC